MSNNLKIALNCARKPNRGIAYESDLTKYDALIREPWLSDMVSRIQSGEVELKDELPVRCSHYYRFRDNHRRQADMDAEAFLFQTCVDIDDKELVDEAIQRAYLINNEEGGQWHDMLLHMEYSARKKLHIDIRMPLGMTIEETQQAYCQALGVPYDNSCTSPERFILITDASQEIYRSEHWYEVLSEEELKERREAFLKRGLTIDGRKQKGTTSKHVALQPQQQDLFPEMKPADLDPRCLKAFDLCMDEAGLTERALQIEGVRHNSLVSIFSVGACRLMSQEQMMAVIRTRMPEYAAEKDCQQLVADFYQNYTEMNRPMTKRLREIHAEAFNEPNDEDNEQQQEEATTTKMHTFNLRLLPSGLREPVMTAPDNMRMNVLSAIMPVAAAYADQVEVEYADNKRQHLGLMSMVIGRQAGGKSSSKEAVETWMKPLSDESREARQQEEAIKEKNKLRKANERAEELPKVPVRKVPITISCSTLLRRFKNAPRRTLVSFGEELDTLLKTNGAGNWSAKYDVYRLSFDRGEWGQDYNSDQAESGEVNVAYNWTIFGTYGAFNRCFNRENVENGLAGRVLMSEMPDTRFCSIPKYTPMTERQQQAVWDAAKRLQEMTGFVDTPRLRKKINQWLEEKRLLAMKNMDEAMDELRKRSAVIAFRCAVVFHLLSGCEKESKGCVDFMLMMADYVLQNQQHLLSQMMEAQQAKSQTTLGRVSNSCTFDRLPQTFTLDDVKLAKGANYEDSTYRSIVCRWKSEHFIEEIPISELGSDKRPHWRKLSA